VKPQPIRRYSKTDLRRGAIAPVRPAVPQSQVAADEQAALFGDAGSEKTGADTDSPVGDDRDSHAARD
jgi:hypothetical protein